MSAEIRKEIESRNARFMDDFNGGDIAAAASVYTEDAKILPPGAAMVEGRAAIQSFWVGAVKQMGITGARLKTVEFEALGDVGYEVGRYDLSGKSGRLDQGKYVVVWKRSRDGWKWHRDIWNSDKA